MVPVDVLHAEARGRFAAALAAGVAAVEREGVGAVEGELEVLGADGLALAEDDARARGLHPAARRHLGRHRVEAGRASAIDVVVAAVEAERAIDLARGPRRAVDRAVVAVPAAIIGGGALALVEAPVGDEARLRLTDDDRDRRNVRVGAVVGLVGELVEAAVARVGRVVERAAAVERGDAVQRRIHGDGRQRIPFGVAVVVEHAGRGHLEQGVHAGGVDVIGRLRRLVVERPLVLDDVVLLEVAVGRQIVPLAAPGDDDGQDVLRLAAHAVGLARGPVGVAPGLAVGPGPADGRSAAVGVAVAAGPDRRICLHLLRRREQIGRDEVHLGLGRDGDEMARGAEVGARLRFRLRVIPGDAGRPVDELIVVPVEEHGVVRGPRARHQGRRGDTDHQAR